MTKDKLKYLLFDYVTGNLTKVMVAGVIVEPLNLFKNTNVDAIIETLDNLAELNEEEEILKGIDELIKG